MYSTPELALADAFLPTHRFDGETMLAMAPQDAFGVTGVPTAFLIDADGRVVWSGHPATIDVEAEIDALLEAHAQRPGAR